MNIDLIKIMIEIREHTLLFGPKIVHFTYDAGFSVGHLTSCEVWFFSFKEYDIIKEYFFDSVNFIDWVNYKISNSKIEQDIQRYLNLKIFT